MPIICGNLPLGYGILSLTMNLGGGVGGSGVQLDVKVFYRNRTHQRNEINQEQNIIKWSEKEKTK